MVAKDLCRFRWVSDFREDAIDAFEHRLSLRHSPYSSIPLNTSRSLFDEPELTPRYPSSLP